MGQAIKRGTFEERKTAAIKRKDAEKKIRDQKLIEYRLEQRKIQKELEESMLIDDLEKRKIERKKIMEKYFAIRESYTKFLWYNFSEYQSIFFYLDLFLFNNYTLKDIWNEYWLRKTYDWKLH